MRGEEQPPLIPVINMASHALSPSAFAPSALPPSAFSPAHGGAVTKRSVHHEGPISVDADGSMRGAGASRDTGSAGQGLHSPQGDRSGHGSSSSSSNGGAEGGGLGGGLGQGRGLASWLPARRHKFALDAADGPAGPGAGAVPAAAGAV